MTTQDPEERALLGITFCHVCRCDTMPLDVTGRCGFCDTQLVAAERDAPTEPDLCVRCGDVIDRGWKPGRGRRPLYCSDECRKQGWYETPRGRAWQATRSVRRVVKKAAA